MNAKENCMQLSWKSWLSAVAVVVVCGYLSAVAQDAPVSAPPSTPGAGSAQAQPGGRRTMEALSELRWLSQQLNLTEEQKQKLRPIVMDEGEQLRTVRLDEHLPLDQKRAKMTEIRESFRPKIAAILTPEQQEKLKKMQESAQQHHQEQMKSGESESATPKPQ
jgi:periplasmic protein CpxP/Spy